MIQITMTKEEALRLKELLVETRGDASIRSFCEKIDIHWSAWRSWEACDSVPSFENLEKVCKLLGWNLDQMTAYLRTGNKENPPYSVSDLLEYGKALPLEQRVDLARQLLGVRVGV